MKKADLPEVARIEKENFSLPWSEQGFADSMEQENTCFLSAYKNGSIVGNLEQPVQDQRYDTACSHDDICNEKQMYLTLFMLPVLPDQKYR